MFSESRCPASCQGCRHKKFSYDDSVQQKFQFLQNKLQSWNAELKRVLEAPEKIRTAYRKKICLHASVTDHQWKFGLISKKKFIPIPDCPIHHPFVNSVASVLSETLPEQGFPLKYYLVSGKQIMLILKTSVLPDLAWLTDNVKNRLMKLGIEGFWMHLFPSVGNKILGKNNFHLLFGKPRSADDNGMWYGPLSFQQLQPGLYHESLKIAHDFLIPTSEDLMVDLYCGNGNSLKRWEPSGATLVGVELNGETVECCVQNVKPAKVFRGKCNERLPQITQIVNENTYKKHLLYVNPPRTGLEPEVTEWIYKNYRPERMAYLSCSAGTLARDLQILNQNGYQVNSIIPFDFFPFTHHVECLVLLSKNE
jgi:tRNA/tmRNA/rRNA uracil-C5-methylase (TrmA/RlmC/RlmD family)